MRKKTLAAVSELRASHGSAPLPTPSYRSLSRAGGALLVNAPKGPPSERGARSTRQPLGATAPPRTGSSGSSSRTPTTLGQLLWALAAQALRASPQLLTSLVTTRVWRVVKRRWPCARGMNAVLLLPLIPWPAVCDLVFYFFVCFRWLTAIQCVVPSVRETANQTMI